MALLVVAVLYISCLKWKIWQLVVIARFQRMQSTSESARAECPKYEAVTE
jgi:hypothetical protein